jgi:hypothetical protein
MWTETSGEERCAVSEKNERGSRVNEKKDLFIRIQLVELLLVGCRSFIDSLSDTVTVSKALPHCQSIRVSLMECSRGTSQRSQEKKEY